MATKLVSMKMSAKDRQETMATPADKGDAPVYPYGLELRLDNDALEKLGIDPPEVGESLTLTAKVSVTSCSSNQTESGKNQSCSLQITDMALGETGGKSAADTLYDGNAKE